MSIQYVDSNADAVCTLPEPYNISGSNNILSITVDGGSAQVFTLSSGSTRTAANIVTDLSALTSATASVVTLDGINYLRIRTSSALGTSSTILVNAPGNNANSTLGFTATTYNGGSVVSSIILGDTKQNLINRTETVLHSAGWITISGSGTSTLIMQSSMSPNPQNLRMRIQLKDNGGNCVTFTILNVAGTKVGTSGTSNGVQVFPQNGQGFQIIGNKYQVFLFVPGSIAARTFACFGVPYLPPWLQNGVVYEAIWLHGNATSDTDTTSPPQAGFRTLLQVDSNSGNHGYASQICNGNIWDTVGSQLPGNQSLICTIAANIRQISYRWHDYSALLIDPLIGWGLTAASDEILFRGQLWNAFISNEAYPIDTILTSVDSHNWQGITAGNGGTSANSGAATGALRGTLFLTTT